MSTQITRTTTVQYNSWSVWPDEYEEGITLEEAVELAREEDLETFIEFADSKVLNSMVVTQDVGQL